MEKEIGNNRPEKRPNEPCIFFRGAFITHRLFNKLPMGMRMRIALFFPEVADKVKNHLQGLRRPEVQEAAAKTFLYCDVLEEWYYVHDDPAFLQYVQPQLGLHVKLGGLPVRLSFNILERKITFLRSTLHRGDDWGCEVPSERLLELKAGYFDRRNKAEEELDSAYELRLKREKEEERQAHFDALSEERDRVHRADIEDMSRQGWNECTEDGGWYFVD